jgi:hypothetical protein
VHACMSVSAGVSVGLHGCDCCCGYRCDCGIGLLREIRTQEHCTHHRKSEMLTHTRCDTRSLLCLSLAFNFRLPPGWTAANATSWPILVTSTTSPLGGCELTRVSLMVSAPAATGGATKLHVVVDDGHPPIPTLCVRLGTRDGGFVWKNLTNVTEATVTM